MSNSDTMSEHIPGRGGIYGNQARLPSSRSRQRHASSAGTGFRLPNQEDEDDEDEDMETLQHGPNDNPAGPGARPEASENASTFSRGWRAVSGLFRSTNGGEQQSPPSNNRNTGHGQGAGDMPEGGGTGTPHSHEDQEHNEHQTAPQPQPPPPDHWAWLMMATIENLIDVATTTRDQVARLETTMNTPAANRPAPTQPPGPKLAQPSKPRSPIHNKEQVVIRASLTSHWLGGHQGNSPPQPNASMLADYEQQRRVHPRGALPAVHVPGNAILFSSSNKSWNRAMALYFIQHILTDTLNEEVPRRHGTRDFQARDQREYFKTLVKRVCDCVQYIFQVKNEALNAGRAVERNESSRNEMSRSRLLKQRVAKAQNTPWLRHTVPALQMLNDDGMSSDEEDLVHQVHHHIHKHPWRSEAATRLVRAIDVAILDDRRFTSNRKSRRNVRLWTPERSQSRRAIAMPFQAPASLPENFYNWEVLRRRQDFRSRNLDPTDVYHPTQARPDLLTFVRPTLQSPSMMQEEGHTAE